MVARHLEARGIEDPLVLQAMGVVPREEFVSEPLKEFAYEDSALPIEAGQTISQPYIVARMIELLELEPTDKVLEVGAGSGYAAALLARLAREVVALERDAELAELARGRLAALGCANVELRCADGSLGCPERAPFDAILVSAAAAGRVPPALLAQLAPGGRLVAPVGAEHGEQTLLRIEKRADGGLDSRDLGAVQFVPLVEGPG